MQMQSLHLFIYLNLIIVLLFNLLEGYKVGQKQLNLIIMIDY